MDLIDVYAPEFVRSLTTILLVHAASRDQGAIHCAPTLHCLAGDPAEVITSGFSLKSLFLSFVVGLFTGGAIFFGFSKRPRVRLSAAAIALSRSK